MTWVTKRQQGKGIKYLNSPFAFDIETSSFYDNDEKRAVMYGWSFADGDNVIIGRTWDGFQDLLKGIREKYDIDIDHRLVIYVHNLAFEFQFFRKRFEWADVFADEDRKPIYALTKQGIEFRCSYFLTGQSLAEVANHLNNGLKKLVGDLDYRLIRHSETPLTDEEIAYMKNDVLIVTSRIREEIEKTGGIHRIPLTKTGYVRRFMREQTICLKGDKEEVRKTKNRYQTFMELSKIKDFEEYQLLKKCFMGGFTHANANHVGHILKDVASYDLISAYPSVIVKEKYPMGESKIIEIHDSEEAERYMTKYACIFNVRFHNLKSKIKQDHYLSFSKCWRASNDYVIDNGRVVSCGLIETTMNEIDYEIMKKAYTWSKVEFGKFHTWEKSYLPPDFVKGVLKLYKDKTTLKDVEGREYDYQLAKSNLNSVYGMMVTDIVRDDLTYSDLGWVREIGDKEEEIKKYNESFTRFTYYPWGIYVTSYVRKIIWDCIFYLENNFVYSDTDSVKCLGLHTKFFEEFNKKNEEQMKLACNANGIEHEYIQKTIKGEIKILGNFEYEGSSNLFKTIGAKRYLTYDLIHGYKLTCAGLSKKSGLDYLTQQSNPFDIFNDKMVIPPEHSGRLTHTYLDDERSGMITDYLGVTAPYNEKSAVHLEPSEYTLDMSLEYREFLFSILNRIEENIV